MFHIGFVAILRDSHRQRVYLRITKEILHSAPLRKLESLRGILSPLLQHPDALRRMDQTDGWKRWVWKRSLITLGYPLHFQSGRQSRGGLRMVGQSPRESRPMCAKLYSKLWGESARRCLPVCYNSWYTSSALAAVWNGGLDCDWQWADNEQRSERTEHTILNGGCGDCVWWTSEITGIVWMLFLCNSWNNKYVLRQKTAVDSLVFRRRHTNRSSNYCISYRYWLLVNKIMK